MTRKPDLLEPDLPATVRTRVRLPRALATAKVFAGWGPELGR